MTDKRWHELMNNDDLDLSNSEIKEGWHFCWDWDGLLIGPGMGETKNCSCLETYKERFPELYK